MGKTKTYKLQVAPCGMPQSSHGFIYGASCDLSKEVYLGEPCVKVDYKHQQYEAYYILSCVDSRSVGWVYAHELVGFCNATNKEDLTEEKERLELELGDVKLKIQWMEENGINEFDENEFKVYKTLKLLENDDMSTIEKSKLIAKLIKG